jgi:hypothetical protein
VVLSVLTDWRANTLGWKLQYAVSMQPEHIRIACSYFIGDSSLARVFCVMPKHGDWGNVAVMKEVGRSYTVIDND